jgi:hypothetical protein
MTRRPTAALESLPPPEPGAVVRREVVELETASLRPNPRNPRKHSDDQIMRLVASLRMDGQTKPVLARRANRMLIAGHGVHQAATRLGIEQLSVVLLDIDQKAADRIMLGDNRASDLSTSDRDRVAELLREIDETEWLATGFTPEEAGKLFETVEAGDLEVHEIEFGDLNDTFWISVRGPLVDQAHALKRLKVLMGDMPKVEVTLGTTEDLL